MENATKALLIAAAVLISILVISLGVVIYQKAAETVNSAGDLSEYEVQQFNEKFLKYRGSNVSGSDVNALMETIVNSNNSSARNGDSRYVKLTIGTSATINAAPVASMPATVGAGDRYKVEVTLNSKTGIVTEVKATKLTT